MAFKKQTEVASGAVGEYWKITNIHINKKQMELGCMVSLFKDKTAADEGKASMFQVSFTFPISKSEVSEDLFALAYEKIKALNVDSLSKISHNKTGAVQLKNATDS